MSQFSYIYSNLTQRLIIFSAFHGAEQICRANQTIFLACFPNREHKLVQSGGKKGREVFYSNATSPSSMWKRWYVRGPGDNEREVTRIGKRERWFSLKLNISCHRRRLWFSLVLYILIVVQIQIKSLCQFCSTGEQLESQFVTWRKKTLAA